MASSVYVGNYPCQGGYFVQPHEWEKIECKSAMNR